MGRNTTTTDSPAAAGDQSDPPPAAAGDRTDDVFDEWRNLVAAVGRVNGVTFNDKTPILAVTVTNDAVRVEYVDRNVVSAFEPDPVRTISAPVKIK